MRLGWGRKPEPGRRNPTRPSDEGGRFRRSVTLTGTQSERVRTAGKDRAQLQTARQEAQTQRRKRHKLLRRVSFLMLFLLVAWAAFANRITAYDVQIAGNIVRPPDRNAYGATARQFAQSDVKNHFIFGLNGQELTRYMIAKHQEIGAITVERHLFDSSPTLKITMRHPVLIWQTRPDQPAFYVDASGVTFLHNAYGDDEKLVQVNDQSGVPAELGTPVASSRQIRFLGQFVGEVAASSKGSVAVAKVVFPPSSTKQVDVSLSGRNYYGKIYLERAARAQAEQLVRSMQYLEQKSTIPAEYVDVRTAERVFYK